MTGLFSVLALLVSLAVLAVPVWLIVRVRRISGLERELHRLEARIDALCEDRVGQWNAAQDRKLSTAKTAVERATPTPVLAESAQKEKAATAPIGPSAAPVEVLPAAIPEGAARVRVVHRHPPAPPSASTKSPVRTRSSADRHPHAHLTHHSSAELEETLGTNWLNKLGALLLVLGVASFLIYQLRTFGPAGKDAVGIIVAVLLLGGGLMAERRTEYRMFSRGSIAAGWALLFFTTFALYHVAAAQILRSQVVDLILMLLVAGGMVGHALRYRSQVVTGLAFLFAFTTVAISHDTAFTLTAGAVLAVASVTVAVRMRWFVLELGAIVATYANHFLWLLTLGANPPELAPPMAHASLALLGVYWLTFRASYVVRRHLTTEEEQISSLGAFVNSLGLVFLVSQHPYDPTLTFWLLVGLGATDALLACRVRSRRTAFALLATLASTLIAAAFPVRFSGSTVSYVWLLEAEALVVIGLRVGDSLFTRLGVVVSALAGLYLTRTDLFPLMSARAAMDAYTTAPGVALLLGVAAAVYYGNSLWVRPTHPAVAVITTPTPSRAPLGRLASCANSGGAARPNEISTIARVVRIAPPLLVGPLTAISSPTTLMPRAFTVGECGGDTAKKDPVHANEYVEPLRRHVRDPRARG